MNPNGTHKPEQNRHLKYLLVIDKVTRVEMDSWKPQKGFADSDWLNNISKLFILILLIYKGHFSLV